MIPRAMVAGICLWCVVLGWIVSPWLVLAGAAGFALLVVTFPVDDDEYDGEWRR